MPTSKGNGQVPVMAEYLAEEFRAGGISGRRRQRGALRQGVDDKTASLVVRYRGNGNAVASPSCSWRTWTWSPRSARTGSAIPIELIEENGFFYGRGTYDVKQGVVAITSTFLRLKAEGFVPSRDLIIYFSGDEETAQAHHA